MDAIHLFTASSNGLTTDYVMGVDTPIGDHTYLTPSTCIRNDRTI
jgi:hypothetical protein